MKGLLRAAEHIRIETQPVPEFQNNSMISSEEQQDIMKQIDKISGHSRIQVTPDLFKISALKKGILFPLVVNLFAVSILGGGIFATKYYFEIKDQEMVLASSEQKSAEGNLIKEIQKEAKAKLNEKESEILSIQANMEQIESERLALETEMNSKISVREAQLQTEMDATLAAERTKMESQGMSVSQINQQIAQLELQQASVFEQKLDNFREEAKREKIEIESSLNQLQNEYNSKLLSVNDERDKIVAEAQNREAELTARMEMKTREMETEKTEAQQTIQILTKAKEQESLIENQIIGFYKTIEDLINEGELDRASTELKKLENYLYDDSVINLAGIAKRREIDLFVIDSLSRLIDATVTKPQEELDTMSLLDAAERLKEVQNLVQNADQQLAVGNDEMADLMYRNALEKIPGISRSHRFFLDTMELEMEHGYEQLSDIQNRFDQLQKETLDRKARVSSLLVEADRTYDSGNYRDAITAYKKAFEATGYDNLDMGATKMIASGNSLAVAPFRETINKMTENVSILKEKQESLEEELAEKETMINSFNTRLQGREEDVTILNDKLQTNEIDLASLSDKLASQKTQVVSLKEKLEVQTNEISTYEQRIEEIKLDLERERFKVSTNNNESKLIDSEIAELTTLKAQLNRLNKSYTDFELMADNLEDNIQGDAQTIEAIYGFFEEDSVEDVMPGISEYLRSFSSVYITAGQEIGLYEAVSLLYDLNNIETDRVKKQFLTDKKEYYKSNEAMIEMIKEIEKSLLREGSDE